MASIPKQNNSNDGYWLLKNYREVRGGGWANHAEHCQSENRYVNESNSLYGILGFRVMRKIKRSKQTKQAKIE